ncbi:hypothetical protein Pan153_13060 [Gimesia panareensis]|uniref:Uncharacterized protein n=1 Tax=Gimesia panareensis TaxID=2527978 RepID=A0A518FJZ2_9PLAN|nr:hypothetical protein [Gimesia panareensis]QDV16675.1 hypothetical protein Pan153_13060 [Gimesia panareensis]
MPPETCNYYTPAQTFFSLARIRNVHTTQLPGLLLNQNLTPEIIQPGPEFALPFFTASTLKIKISIFTYFIDNDMDCDFPEGYAV